MASLVRLLIAFIIFRVSISSTTESVPWCSLEVSSPQSVGSMECKFSEEVQFIQVDFYPFGSQDPPVIAFFCDQTICEPNANFMDMLKVSSPSKQLLTVEVHEVSQAHAGNYRCQAQSIASFLTVEGICSFRYPNPGHQYIVEVFTSDIVGAGTDSNIFIKLFGTNGTSNPLRLKPTEANFERGSKDRFNVESPYIGELCSVLISSDNMLAFPAWHLMKISVWSSSEWPPYNFWCDCWISSTTRLERTLYPDIPCKR